MIKLKDQGYSPIKEKEGVLFVTYSALVARAHKGKRSRFKQIVQWCGGEDFDGLILFDECHKAKNVRSGTKAGQAVQELQDGLPNARVVYCSATGVSEPKHMAYMTRLGIWGPSTAFPSGFDEFCSEVLSNGVGMMEMVAMHLKQEGAFVCRTLSFMDCTFELIDDAAAPDREAQYDDATAMWVDLLVELKAALAADEVGDREKESDLFGDSDEDEGCGYDKDDDESWVSPEAKQKRSKAVYRYYWGAHQRFFRALCVTIKVPAVIEQVKLALENEVRSVITYVPHSRSHASALTFTTCARAPASALAVLCRHRASKHRRSAHGCRDQRRRRRGARRIRLGPACDPREGCSLVFPATSHAKCSVAAATRRANGGGGGVGGVSVQRGHLTARDQGQAVQGAFRR